MNDIQRQFLILATMLILVTWKIADCAKWAVEHWNNGFTILLAIYFLAWIFKLKYDAYKRKGGL